MLDITTYRRFDGETDEELIYRITGEKDKIGSWQDVADILNDLLGTEYTESKFRKQRQSFDKLFAANQQKFATDVNILEEITQERRNLEKERKKIQSEKIEYNRWLRENARDELISERICESIADLKPLDIPERISVSHGKREYALIFGDEHYGVEFEIPGINGEIINAYSPEIFEKRMWSLFHQTLEVIASEEIDTLYVFSMGDYMDGILRVSQLMKLRYGVVESTIKYAEFMANWLNEMSQYVNIKYHCTHGNHSELRLINQPKNTFTDDNMGEIVSLFIKERLQDNPNFTFVENHTGYIYNTLAGYSVFGCHGEIKNKKIATREISSIYGIPINYFITGHVHHNTSEEVGIDSEVISVGSIVGTDNYALSLRKTSNASAKLLVFEENKGKVCEYTFKLN